MTPVIRVRRSPAQGRNAGFTLLEILVAFGLLSVASFILISMFRHSMELSSEVSHRRVAARLAEEVLSDMRHNPAAYKWPTATDQLQPVEQVSSDAPLVTPPAVTATYLTGDKHIRDFYNEFKWRGYARLPKADAQVCELTVVVFWTDNGRQQRWTLTTLAPLRVLEGKS